MELGGPTTTPADSLQLPQMHPRYKNPDPPAGMYLGWQIFHRAEVHHYETEICKDPPGIKFREIIACYEISWDVVEFSGMLCVSIPNSSNPSIHPSFFRCCRPSPTSHPLTGYLISAQGTLPKITTANSRFTRFNRSAKGPKAKLVAPAPAVWLNLVVQRRGKP